MGRIVLHFEVDRADPVPLTEDPNTVSDPRADAILSKMNASDWDIDELIDKVHDFISMLPTPEGLCLRGWWTDEDGNLHLVSLNEGESWD